MNEIYYLNTRDQSEKVTASQAILSGMAGHGGLYVPERIPALTESLTALAEMNYKQLAYCVMSKFLTDYTEDELRTCIDNAYDSKFDTEEIAPLREADGAYFLELFHGATIAFKDMALSILPHLLTTAARKNSVKEDTVILTATSGDTGKAALAGFADVAHVKIIVFYPKDGVSLIQQRQMVTQKGDNTFVVGIHGNFDEAQTGVKKMFGDARLAGELESAGYKFSSANSINVGRLVPQIAYYVWAYSRLVKSGAIKAGDEINFTVPTGNFGNILAGFYAKQMGLPVKKFICASNENKVLYDFFGTGIYDKNRKFVLTSSPSMDILVSSNLERLIYRITGCDPEKTSELMKQLETGGKYEITPEMREGLKDFVGYFCTEPETAATIKRLHESDNYIIDPHTAVAAGAYDKYRRDTGDKTPTVIVSTASPYKFAGSVLPAIFGDSADVPQDPFDAIEKLHEVSGVAIPNAVGELRSAEIRHKTTCEPEEMEGVVKGFLGVK